MNPELLNAAKNLYFSYMQLDADEYEYMWDQCNSEYRLAWVTIAKELPYFKAKDIK